MFSEKYLNTIPNLTLSGNNGPLGNKTFPEKREMNLNGNEQGYRYSRLWLNDFPKTIDHRDIANFEKRFEQIYLRFLGIWPTPDVEIQTTDSAFEEQAIFDAESPRHRKLEYFIFEDTKVEEEAIAQMYFYVIRQLYDRNPQLLVESQNVFKIIRESSDFRYPQEITNGWYVEANIDSDTKFASLKKLLILFDMEDDLVIKYAPDSKTVVREASRHGIRRAYWKQLLPQITGTQLFVNVNPTKDHWITAGAGITGLGFTLVATKSYVRIELAISTSSKEINKRYFRRLYKNNVEIEHAFGRELIWEELPDSKMSRVKIEFQGVSLFNESDWEAMNEFLTTNIPIFERAFRPYISERVLILLIIKTNIANVNKNAYICNMEKRYQKYRGIHPGIVLDRELKKRSIKQRPFALALQEHPQTFNAITKGRRGISTPLALKIERELGLEEGTLVLLQAYYDIQKVKEQEIKVTPDLNILNKALFWDTDISKIDWERQYRAVIQRVFERGSEEEKQEIIRFYGKDKINMALEESKARKPYTIYRPHVA